MVPEDGHQLGAAVDLDCADRERSVGEELVKRGFGAGRESLSGDTTKRPFGDRIVGGEVFERSIGAKVDLRPSLAATPPPRLVFSPLRVLRSSLREDATPPGRSW
jgi:hypothetical protein